MNNLYKPKLYIFIYRTFILSKAGQHTTWIIARSQKSLGSFTSFSSLRRKLFPRTRLTDLASFSRSLLDSRVGTELCI